MARENTERAFSFEPAEDGIGIPFHLEGPKCKTCGNAADNLVGIFWYCETCTPPTLVAFHSTERH